MFRPIQRQAATAGAAALTVGGIALYPRRNAYAEAPPDRSWRKPIYDEDNGDNVKTKQKASQTSATEQDNQSQPTLSLPTLSQSQHSSESPTDQLASRVRDVRLFLHSRSLAAENAFNDALSRVFHVESRFTNTIASLAPSVESGERLVPGSIYVLVSAMAGSIVSRNRGVILRASTPLVFGTVAAYTLLPVTMQNVAYLAWQYEKRVPALAEQHIRVRTAAEDAWNTAVAHSKHSRELLESKIGDGRRALEEWTRKGN